MGKFVAALTASVVALAMPFAARAQSFSPVGATVSGDGQMWISQSMDATCNFGFIGSVSSSALHISSRSMSPGGDFNCVFMTPQGIWSAATVPGDATKIDITLGFNTITNEPCYGTVRGDWDNAGKILTINGTYLWPTNAGDQPCHIRTMDIFIADLNLS